MKDLVQLVRFLRGTAAVGPLKTATLVLALLAGTAAGLAGIGLIVVIDEAISATAAERLRLLGVFVALCLAQPILRLLSSWLLAHLSQTARSDLEIQISRSILAAPLHRIERAGSSRLLSALTEDVGNLITALTNLPVILRLAAVLAGGVLYLAVLSVPLFLRVVVAFALGVFSYRALVRLGSSSFTVSRGLTDRLFKSFQALTGGLKELKLHRLRREAFLEEELATTARARAKAQIRAQGFFALAGGWGQLLSFVAMGAVLFFSPADADTMTGFTLTILFLLSSLDNLLGLTPSLHRATVSLQHLRKLNLWLDEEVETVRKTASAEQPWSRIELAGATHAYSDETGRASFLLGPIDLTIERGACVFLVGGNGSGKTTLGKLLTGLYLPNRGALRLDGTRIGETNSDRLRSLFSAVFTDFHLFPTLPGLKREGWQEDAQGLLERLDLAHKVKLEAGGLSTVDLSQGQRKRLALMTAYLEDRPIYLFDEWAADQDPQFKEVFYRQLIPRLLERGKTVVVITHDDRYFDLAQRIVKLDSGKVVFDGAPVTPVVPAVSAAV